VLTLFPFTIIFSICYLSGHGDPFYLIPSTFLIKPRPKVIRGGALLLYTTNTQGGGGPLALLATKQLNLTFICEVNSQNKTGVLFSHLPLLCLALQVIGARRPLMHNPLTT
jgi:hypothetical protein